MTAVSPKSVPDVVSVAIDRLVAAHTVAVALVRAGFKVISESGLYPHYGPPDVHVDDAGDPGATVLAAAFALGLPEGEAITRRRVLTRDGYLHAKLQVGGVTLSSCRRSPAVSHEAALAIVPAADPALREAAGDDGAPVEPEEEALADAREDR